MDDDFSSQLDDWLSATADRYEVERTLKQGESERTEVVYRRTADGARMGPFVRKVFMGESLGQAYERVYQAQVDGKRLLHQPFIYECERHGGTLEVVMEFVHGVTLRDLVAQDGASVATARLVMPDLCRAVSELHTTLDEPIIHRDIKPSNIMLDDSRIVLIDLGIARTWHKDAQRDTIRYGTPGYAPPEQYGYGQTSVRSDVYALGMVLAFCLVGEEPDATMLEEGFCDKRVPDALRPVLVKATSFDPTARYASAAELEQAIEAAWLARTASTPPSPSPSTPMQPMRFARLGKAWNVLLAVVLALLTLLCAMASISPTEQSAIAHYPFWFRVFGYITIVIIPVGCLFFLVMDKRRLRSHPLFAKRSWVKELFACLGIVFGWLLITILLFAILISPPANT